LSSRPRFHALPHAITLAIVADESGCGFGSVPSAADPETFDATPRCFGMTLGANVIAEVSCDFGFMDNSSALGTGSEVMIVEIFAFL